MRHIVTTRDLICAPGKGLVFSRRGVKFMGGMICRMEFLGTLLTGSNLPVSEDVAEQWTDIIQWEMGESVLIED